MKTPAANTPNTLDPFPFPFLSAALPVTLSYLSSPGSIPFRPQLFPSPSPSRKNRKNLKAPLNRVHVFLLLTDFPPPLSSPRLFAPRLFATRVSRFAERVSRDVTPAFRSPLFLLSFPPSFFGFRGTRGPGKPVISKRTKKKKVFSVTPFPFGLNRCCRFSTPLDT